MISVPFIYFSILLAYIIKTKKTFDISAYLVSLYLVSSFFSIVIDANNLRSFDTQNFEIGIVPTFLYCFLLTIVIWPFYRLKVEKTITIGLNKPKLFDRIVYFYFACFLLILLSSFGTIVSILSGDLGELRIALNKGDEIGDVPYGGGALSPLFMVANIFGGFSIVMLLFYFYSICFLKRSKYYNFIILLSSMTIIVIGILGVDRSKTVYWMITYGFMLILFWRHMPMKQRRRTVIISATLLSAVISYFLALTISRFGERDGGSEGGIISYAGQSFINFCYFFDHVDYKEFSLQRVFPLFYKLFVDNDIRNSAELNTEIALKTGKEIAVFSTFIGDIMVASGRIVAIIYCVLFSLIARKITNFRSYTHLNFYQVLLLFCFISIPLLGLFSHFYNSFPKVITLILFLFYALHLKFNLYDKPKRRVFSQER